MAWPYTRSAAPRRPRRPAAHEVPASNPMNVAAMAIRRSPRSLSRRCRAVLPGPNGGEDFGVDWAVGLSRAARRAGRRRRRWRPGRCFRRRAGAARRGGRTSAVLGAGLHESAGCHAFPARRRGVGRRPPAAGRGFECLQPLLRKPAPRAGLRRRRAFRRCCPSAQPWRRRVIARVGSPPGPMAP
jgi:hypothetical protein